MVHVAEHPSKEANRLRKAIRLANVIEQTLRELRQSIDDTEVDDIDWESARQIVGSRDLPSPQCKALVVSILREREAVFDGDPFAGLPQGRAR